jgi:UDP-2,3-diacylglucosamine pyrophosphatase LpxH
MREGIPIKVKRECCRMKLSGIPARTIYDEFYVPNVEHPCTFASFKRTLNKWDKQPFPDDTTLECGTYEGFVAHNATVQVSKSGEIVQAWIKQRASDFDPEDFINAIRGNVEPYAYERRHIPQADRMLEIPLFDMHWGVSFLTHYEPVLNDLLALIHSRHWDRIEIPVGQDFFHNDSIVNAVTTKGTVIDKADMTRAVREGRQFITALIDGALASANNVRVFYSPGNHDRSISWMFMQVLRERYGTDIVDDSMEYRKVITYGENSVMVTHGDSKQATAKNLAHIFPISYPKEFAQATTREVHSGHLHHESEADIFGVMVRRLSSGVAVDDWSNRQDFVGSHRRFMVFEWGLDGLRSIHYI